MLKFFRSIRQRLLYNGKSGKYLKYAVGEIVLVVIGILIALQINNWNEVRKQNLLEQDYLKTLKREYEKNLVEVNRVIVLTGDLLENAKELSKYTGPKVPDLNEKEFSDLLLGTINAEVQYRPGSGVTNEIIHSGKLNIFRNTELKSALAAMDGLLLRIRFQETEELAMMRNDLLIMCMDNVSIRRLAYHTLGDVFGLDDGNFDHDNTHLLKSMQFDNRLTGFILTAGYLEVRYEELRVQIQEIVDIIDSQID